MSENDYSVPQRSGEQPYNQAQQPYGQSSPQGQLQPYPQQPYSQPYVQPYGQMPPAYMPVPETSNSRATAGMVLGILGCVLFLSGIFMLAMNVLAIVFGALSLKQANRTGGVGHGKAVAGIVLGCVGLAIYLLVGIFTLGIFWVF